MGLELFRLMRMEEDAGGGKTEEERWVRGAEGVQMEWRCEFGKGV